MFVFRLRRDYSWRWVLENPILNQGEPGYEIDTGRFKIGDGYTRWQALEYFIPTDESNASLPEHVNSETPHPVYDDGPSLTLLYQNAKV